MNSNMSKFASVCVLILATELHLHGISTPPDWCSIQNIGRSVDFDYDAYAGLAEFIVLVLYL